MNELRPLVLTLLAEARELLDFLLQNCDSAEVSVWGADREAENIWTFCLPFERAIDAAMGARLGSLEAIEEIACMAQIELGQRSERLERLTPGYGDVSLLTECDSSVRRIRKALSAVDAAIAKAASCAPVLDFTSELETSLAVRRVYGKFRARVMKGGEPTPETLKARLRVVGTQIAVLVGLDVYQEFRVRDRLVLRELQTKLLGWLRGTGDASVAGGIRLWQDLAACIEMFALVNRRQELVEHDEARLAELREVWGTLAERGHLDDATLEGTLETLDSLRGYSAELDELLERQAGSAEGVRRALELLFHAEEGAARRSPATRALSRSGEPPW